MFGTRCLPDVDGTLHNPQERRPDFPRCRSHCRTDCYGSSHSRRHSHRSALGTVVNPSDTFQPPWPSI